MLGRNGNIAYVRYDSHGRIVPGGPIISPTRPKVGNWQPVSNVIGTSVTSNSLRAFIRIDYANRVVPSSLLLLAKAPDAADSGTHWLEINATYRPEFVPTTTTTTSTTSTTSTTTTTAILDCALGAVVNSTFVGGPVGVTVTNVCNTFNEPVFRLSNFTGGSGQYTLLRTSWNQILLQYPETSYATNPITPPISSPYDLIYVGFAPGTKLWILFADANNLNNQILIPLTTENCPGIPSNTVFMKFNILQ